MGVTDTPRGVRPRTLWTAIGVILVCAALAFALWYLSQRRSGPAGVDYRRFQPDSVATVSFAGQFPDDGRRLLERPLGIDGDGDRLYVALADSGTIAVFRYDGSELATLVVPPAEGAPVAYPVDLRIDDDGSLLVVDTSGQRVVRMDARDGNELAVLGAPADDGAVGGRGSSASGRSEGTLIQPTAIEVHEGTVFVADAGDSTVKVYDSGGELVGAIGAGIEPPLTFVSGMRVIDGVLWVSDANAGRAIALDPGSGSMQGSLQRRLDLPRGIAADSAGRIFVVETFGRVVRVFSPEGDRVVDVVGDAGTEGYTRGGALNSPEKVLYDERSNRLYVTDSAAGRVKVYNIRKEDDQ